MRIGLGLLGCLLTICACGGGTAEPQRPSPVAAEGVELVATSSAPASYLAPEHANALYIDLEQVVRAIRNLGPGADESLRRLVSERDIESWSGLLGYLPKRLGLGLNEEASSFIGSASQLLFLIVVMARAPAARQPAWIGEEVLSLARSLRHPGGVAWMELRSPEAALVWMDRARQLSDRLRTVPGVAVTSSKSAIRVDLAVKDLVTRGELSTYIVRLHLASGFDDPSLTTLVDALMAFETSVAVSAHGSTLLVRLGKPSATASHAPAPWDPDDVLWGRWDADLPGFARRMQSVLDRLGPAATNQMIAQLGLSSSEWTFLTSDLASFAPRGVFSVTSGRDLTWQVRRQGIVPPPALEAGPMMAIIDHDWPMVYGSREMNIGSMLGHRIYNAEPVLKRWLGEDDYQKYFRKLRASLLSAAAELTSAGPAAFIATVDGVLSRIVLRKHGKPVTEIALGTPLVELALVGPSRVVDASNAFAETLCRQFVRAAVQLETDKDAGDCRLVQSDLHLGEGIRTWTFSNDLLRRIGAGDVELDADVLLHVAVTGSLYIVSTSPRLTREIIAVSRAPDSGLAGSQIIDRGLMRGDAFARLTIMATSYAHRTGTQLVAPRLLETLSNVLGRVEWTTRIEGQDVVTRGTVAGAQHGPPPLRPAAASTFEASDLVSLDSPRSYRNHYTYGDSPDEEITLETESYLRSPANTALCRGTRIEETDLETERGKADPKRISLYCFDEQGYGHFAYTADGKTTSYERKLELLPHTTIGQAWTGVHGKGDDKNVRSCIAEPSPMCADGVATRCVTEKGKQLTWLRQHYCRGVGWRGAEAVITDGDDVRLTTWSSDLTHDGVSYPNVPLAERPLPSPAEIRSDLRHIRSVLTQQGTPADNPTAGTYR